MDDTEPAESLGSIGKKVSVEFETLYLGHLLDEDRSHITIERQRFELWAVNLGLYHGGHSSLDYRFRDSPPLLRYAYKLLRDLETGLADVKASLNDSPLPSIPENHNDDHDAFKDTPLESEPEDDDSEEDFSSYQTVSLSRAHINNVTTSIDRLYRLTFKIRNPAMRIGLSKAIKYQEMDPDTGISLFDVYALLDKRHVVELFRFYGNQNVDLSDSNYLIERLARANTRRRQQFRYWGRRKVKYEMYSKLTAPISRADDVGTEMKRYNIPVNHPRHAPSQPSTATRLNADQVNLEDDVSVISTKTFLIIENEKSDDHCSVPPPPIISPGAKEFECPICFAICPHTILSKRAWETHVFRDLRPYVCTFENCKEPDQQYDTLTDWIAHETSNHGVNVSHQVDHQENTRDCPVCLSPNENSIHIACHLRRISCFSLPQSIDESNDSAIGSEISRQARLLSHSSDRSSLESVSWEAWADNVSTGREPSASMMRIETLDPFSLETAEFPEQRQEDIIAGMQSMTLPSQHEAHGAMPDERLGFVLADQIVLTSVLGIDGRGRTIYTGVDIHTKFRYAVKALPKSDDEKEMAHARQEIRLHHMATQHHNVVPLIRIMDSPDCIYAVMEFPPQGDLFNAITEKGMYVGEDLLVKRVFVQILDAVHQCHTLDIYHFNIQPEHIFVADQGNTLKLSNFELATANPSSMAFNYKRDFYASPESLSSDPISEAYASVPHDVWSLGVILINLTCGRNPWKLASIEDSTYRAHLKNPKFLQSLLPLNDDSMAILNRIFELNPYKRISIPELRGLILDCPRFTIAPLSIPSGLRPVDSPGIGDQVGSDVDSNKASLGG